MSSDNYRKIEHALARQRREAESHQRALDRAANTSCANLRILDVADVIDDAIQSSERNVIKHVQRMLLLRDVNNRPEKEKERVLNLHRRLTELESQVRALAKVVKR
jgi:hypothetical protein